MPVQHETIIKKVVLGVAISSLLAGCGSSGNDNSGGIITTPTISTLTSSSVDASSSLASNSSEAASSDAASSSEPAIVYDFIEPTTQQKVKVVFSAESSDLSATEETTLSISFQDAETEEAIDLQGTLSITSTCGDNGQALISSVTDTNTFTYLPAGCSGNDNVVLSGEWADGVTYTQTVKLDIDEAAGSVSAVSLSETKLDIDGSGGIKTTDVTFSVKYRSGNPIANEQVNFALTEPGTGASLSAAFANTDENGLATVTVSSGSKPGPIRIKAIHVSSGLTGVSDTISIGTGLPSPRRFALSADIYNPNAYKYAGGQKVNLTARAADSTGNPVSDGTIISFWNLETGSMPTSCQSLDGGCSVEWTPAGGAGRPDNGRIQVAALINVAEEFNDNNANFIFDDGDTINCRPLTGAVGEPAAWGAGCVEPIAGREYTDLVGSYIDINESGEFEVEIDRPVDSNGNKMRDLGDGKWTGPNCQHSNPADYCSDKSMQSMLFAKSITLTLSRDDSPSYCGGTGVGQGFEFVGRAVPSEGLLRFDGLSISDGNIYALNPGNSQDDCPTGNALPAGTKVEFSAEFGTIKNLTGLYPVSNTSGNPADMDYGFTYAAPKLSEDDDGANIPKYDSITLTLTMPAPFGGAQGLKHSAFWQVTVF